MLEQDPQKMKWKLAQRIATSPSERWLKKAAEWNPDLISRERTNRTIGRPKKRCEDDINEFLKQEFEENENPIERGNQTNKTWINIAKDRRRWRSHNEDTITITKSREDVTTTSIKAAASQASTK